jgi:pilus assembly protein CpaC
MSRVPRRCNQQGRSGQTVALLLLAFFAITFIASIPSGAVERAARRSDRQDGSAVRHIDVVLNHSRTISFDKPFRLAVPSATTIADVIPRTPQSLYIQGKALGTTNISIYDDNMQLLEIVDLEVTVDTTNLQEKIRASTGSNSIRVSSSNGEVVLSGMAPDAVTADRVVSIARGIAKGPDVVNAMTVAPSQQVMLKVRFLEASRQAERDIGVNWFGSNASGTRGVSTGLGAPTVGTGGGGVPIFGSAGSILSSAGGQPFGVVLANLVNGGTNIDVMVSALETKGLVRRLAEPDLVALSGDEARFLAGGEFPVPIAVSTTTGAGITPTIEFKKFGVSLGFVPTVLNRGMINLRIAPEVSELDFSNTITISGTVIPSLVVRNAQTTIELRDGQSFAIAGLLQSRGARNISQVPWIGSVPVLGTLFRSSAFQNNESDLVIIVTPHIVRPGTPVDRLATPLDQRLPSNDTDFFVNGQLEVPKRYSDYVTTGGNVNGPYGYILPVEQGSSQPVYKGGMTK